MIAASLPRSTRSPPDRSQSLFLIRCKAIYKAPLALAMSTKSVRVLKGIAIPTTAIIGLYLILRSEKGSASATDGPSFMGNYSVTICRDTGTSVCGNRARSL